MASDGQGDGVERKLDRVARKECPSCGGSEWFKDPEQRTLIIPATLDDKVISGLETLWVVCERCGYVRFHSLDVLRGLD